MNRGAASVRSLLLGAWLWILGGQDARAHKTSDSYLRVEVKEDQVRGQWSLALHDLEFAVGLDGNEDGAITWGELKSRREAVIDYARSRLAIEADGTPVSLQFAPDLQVEQLANQSPVSTFS